MAKMYGWSEGSKSKIVKSRVHCWFDTEQHKPRYGVQVKSDMQTHKFFAHVFNGDGVVLFDTEAEAEQFRSHLQTANGVQP